MYLARFHFWNKILSFINLILETKPAWTRREKWNFLGEMMRKKAYKRMTRKENLTKKKTKEGNLMHTSFTSLAKK